MLLQQRGATTACCLLQQPSRQIRALGLRPQRFETRQLQQLPWW
jgi:hypothetical protein